jgi:hypothetical protein
MEGILWTWCAGCLTSLLERSKTFRYGPRLLIQPESNTRRSLAAFKWRALFVFLDLDPVSWRATPFKGTESQSLLMHIMLRVKFLQILRLLSAVVIAVASADPGQGRTMVNTLEKRNLVTTLGPQLSSEASIYTPSSLEPAEQSLRWSTYSAPTFEFVVVPAVENDIAVTVTTPKNPERRPVLELILPKLTVTICYQPRHSLPCPGYWPWL